VVLVQEFADAGDLFTLLHRWGRKWARGLGPRQGEANIMACCCSLLPCSFAVEQGLLPKVLSLLNVVPGLHWVRPCSQSFGVPAAAAVRGIC
jgi:hypothetical protein